MSKKVNTEEKDSDKFFTKENFFKLLAMGLMIISGTVATIAWFDNRIESAIGDAMDKKMAQYGFDIINIKNDLANLHSRAESNYRSLQELSQRTSYQEHATRDMAEFLKMKYKEFIKPDELNYDFHKRNSPDIGD